MALIAQGAEEDGEDLCVSKSLASVLHNIGFTVEAEMLDNYGSQKLAGGTVKPMLCNTLAKDLDTQRSDRKSTRLNSSHVD